MPSELPTRAKLYQGPVVHSEIWSDFQLRPDDVIISTPPKCGTTWTQTLVTMLIHGRTGTDIGLNRLSPWLDCGFRDRPALARILRAQDHRRCIKSHTPLDGITYDPSCTYIAVYRHPLDVHFSMRTHVENLRDGLLPSLRARFPADHAEGFRLYLSGTSPTGACDEMTLDAITYHYLSFRKRAALENVHFFHYADLSRDLSGQVARIAAILGIDHPPALIEQIIEGADFRTMKANAGSGDGAKAMDTFRDPAGFFASGTSEKWRTRLDDDQIAAYRARIAELLEPDDIAWIEYGAAGSG